MTYRRGDRRTIAYTVILVCSLLGIAWCEERKR